MIHILILTIWLGRSAHTVTVNFNTKTACEQAIKQYKRVGKRYMIFGVCVAKGSDR